MQNKSKAEYDVIIIGSGVSGSFIAWQLTQKGVKCLMLEAGSYFHAENYPTNEMDSNSKLYWGGGIELNTIANIGILRPKVVGGGSIVNQALLDRFDDDALNSWRSVSGIDFFSTQNLKPFYDLVDQTIISQEISAKYRNRNAEIFEQGFKNNGYTCAPLIRAQKDCKSELGNDCIECLAGCRVDSKQSMPVTVLKTAIESGLNVISNFEVQTVMSTPDFHVVKGKFTNGKTAEFQAGKIVMAAGAIGNSKILLQSGFKNKMIGKNFYTHPQHMILAMYDEPVNAHKGTFQAFKSSDPIFRKAGFKLENVFAPPVAIAMLLPGIGEKHRTVMDKITHLACIEVAIRDTHPGTISINKQGKPIINKGMNTEDKMRMKRGTDAVYSIFKSTGAREIIPGTIPIGLHLMGGCGIGTNQSLSVTSPNFSMHENKNIFIADSSIFPNAPGINPSMTIMAISIKAAQQILLEI